MAQRRQAASVRAADSRHPYRIAVSRLVEMAGGEQIVAWSPHQLRFADLLHGSRNEMRLDDRPWGGGEENLAFPAREQSLIKRIVCALSSFSCRPWQFGYARAGELRKTTNRGEDQSMAGFAC